jgi:hypothetical protein
MLTDHAIRERKWGRYPSLRRVLEEKKVPDALYGLTSVSDNSFDWVNRLMNITILVDKYRADIKNAVPTLGRDELSKDLYEIQSELESCSAYFSGLVDRIGSVLSDVRSDVR